MKSGKLAHNRLLCCCGQVLWWQNLDLGKVAHSDCVFCRGELPIAENPSVQGHELGLLKIDYWLAAARCSMLTSHRCRKIEWVQVTQGRVTSVLRPAVRLLPATCGLHETTHAGGGGGLAQDRPF